MKCNTFAERIKGVLDNDDGVAAVIVAISLLVLLGSAMISIDAGSVWSTRREAVTSTDAAALGAARFFANDTTAGCDAGEVADAQTQAASLLKANSPGSELADFNVEPKSCSVGAGTVEVKSTGKAPLHFAPVFNIADADVESSSTAQWGPIVEIRGLRRLALCVEDPHVIEWIALGRTPVAYQLLDGTPGHPGDTVYPGAGVVHRVEDFAAFDCDPDDKVKSSWAWLDLGRNDSVTLGDSASGDEDCEAGGGPDDCEGRVGSRARGIRGSLRSQICDADTPTDECPMFPIVIYDRAEKDRGNDGLYHPSSYVGVVLRGVDRVDDDEDDDDEGGKVRFFDLEFVNLIWQGTIGTADWPVVHAVQICRTDQNAAHCDV